MGKTGSSSRPREPVDRQLEDRRTEARPISQRGNVALARRIVSRWMRSAGAPTLEHLRGEGMLASCDASEREILHAPRAPRSHLELIGWIAHGGGLSSLFDRKPSWRVGRSGLCPIARPWAVIKKVTDETESCHPTPESAFRHARALQFAERLREPAVTERLLRFFRTNSPLVYEAYAEAIAVEPKADQAGYWYVEGAPRRGHDRQTALPPTFPRPPQGPPFLEWAAGVLHARVTRIAERVWLHEWRLFADIIADFLAREPEVRLVELLNQDDRLGIGEEEGSSQGLRALRELLYHELTTTAQEVGQFALDRAGPEVIRPYRVGGRLDEAGTSRLQHVPEPILEDMDSFSIPFDDIPVHDDEEKDEKDYEPPGLDQGLAKATGELLQEWEGTAGQHPGDDDFELALEEELAEPKPAAAKTLAELVEEQKADDLADSAGVDPAEAICDPDPADLGAFLQRNSGLSVSSKSDSRSDLTNKGPTEVKLPGYTYRRGLDPQTFSTIDFLTRGGWFPRHSGATGQKRGRPSEGSTDKHAILDYIRQRGNGYSLEQMIASPHPRRDRRPREQLARILACMSPRNVDAITGAIGRKSSTTVDNIVREGVALMRGDCASDGRRYYVHRDTEHVYLNASGHTYFDDCFRRIEVATGKTLSSKNLLWP